MYFKIYFFAVISCLLCSYCAAESTTSTNQLNVSIFYETYCQDSIKFITKGFLPIYKTLNSSYLAPQFVPFGNANFTYVNNIYNFTCQHGNKECYGNKVHACLLASDEFSLAEKLTFINCTLFATVTDSDEAYPTDKCAKEANINSTTLNNCISNATLANATLASYGKLTKQYTLPSVPFVIFDGKYDAQKSEKAVRNFSEVLCNDYSQNNKNISQLLSCNVPPKGSASTMTLTALPVIVFTYLVSKMY